MAPSSVHDVLGDTGRPLEGGIRTFMESRFGQDFGSVRIHDDALAHRSSRDIDALAYTHGHHVVFGAEQYRPDTENGRALLAHELAHVVQQHGHGATIQRACGLRQISGIKGCVGLGSELEDYGTKSDDIYKFKVGCDEFLPGEQERFEDLVAHLGPDQIVDVHGFASEEGPGQFNDDLSCARAHKAAGLLYDAGFSFTQVRSLFMHGAKRGIREDLRSVVLDFVGLVPKPPEPPKFLCGPDITKALEQAVFTLKSDFDRLSSGDQEDVCGTLNSLIAGAWTWDVIELYHENNAWIHQNYRPKCASPGATPVCGETVQVGDQCYYSGTANYVIFGVMCRLCQQNLDEDDASDYDEDHMLELIDFYKGPGVFTSASGNWAPSRRWAQAGYHGWPSGGTPPKGDRNHCVPVCPRKYWGPPFHVRWCPHLDPGDQCGIGSRRRRSDRRLRP